MQVNGGSNKQPVPQGSDNRTIILSLVKKQGSIGGIIRYLGLQPNAHDLKDSDDLKTRLIKKALENINKQRNRNGYDPYDFPLESLIRSFEWDTQLIDVVNNRFDPTLFEGNLDSFLSTNSLEQRPQAMQLNMHQGGAHLQTSGYSIRQMDEALRAHICTNSDDEKKFCDATTGVEDRVEEGGRAGGYGPPSTEEKLTKAGLSAVRKNKQRQRSEAGASAHQIDPDSSDEDAPLITILTGNSSSGASASQKDSVSSKKSTPLKHKRKENSTKDESSADKKAKSKEKKYVKSSKLNRRKMKKKLLSSDSEGESPSRKIGHRSKRPRITIDSDDEQSQEASSMDAVGSASQSRPVNLNGQPDTVADLTEQRLRMNSINLVHRMFTNLQDKEVAIDSLELNYSNFVFGMERYLNDSNYEFIPTPNDGQCAIHSIIEVANLIARENGKTEITEKERTEYIQFLIKAIENPANEYIGEITSTHHEIEALITFIYTLDDPISNRLRQLIFNADGSFTYGILNPDNERQSHEHQQINIIGGANHYFVLRRSDRALSQNPTPEKPGNGGHH